MNVLIVVDMQNDFIDGALGTPEAQAIVDKVVEKVKGWDGKLILTMDTHGADYLNTQEGKNLPVPHCIKGELGHAITQKLFNAVSERYADTAIVPKRTFGGVSVVQALHDCGKQLESITLVGLCTDICVISNAMLIKAFFPEVPITVDAACCAGVTPESHKNAIAAMKMCQIGIENEEVSE